MFLFQRSLKILCFSCLMLVFSEMAFAKYGDKIYKDEILKNSVRTVQLYPITNNAGQELGSPIISLNNPKGLLLQFDILEANYSQLQVRIIHCNADWTQSTLNEIEYLQGFNNVDIRDFDYSINTKVMYVNYWINVPKVKITGNYILQVIQDNNTSNVLFNRRFIVFDNLVGINSAVRVSSLISERRYNHQIEFEIQYGRMKVSSPMSEFKVVVRQNQRWDNAIFDLKPTVSNMGKSLIEYEPFDGENNFKAGNEFRFIDLRTYTFRGRFISGINPSPTPIEAQVSLAEPRTGKFYSAQNDMNGNYFIETLEAGAGYLEADYLNVRFNLKTAPIMDAVYLIGAFNFWDKDDRSIMQYDAQNGVYFKNVLLKQGMYDYQFWVEGQNPLMYESSFAQTGNTYEIIIYHKPFSAQSERVVGYKSFIGKL